MSAADVSPFLSRSLAAALAALAAAAFCSASARSDADKGRRLMVDTPGFVGCDPRRPPLDLS